MNLRETILSEYSKTNCIRIVKWIDNSQLRFDELINLLLRDEYRVVSTGSLAFM